MLENFNGQAFDEWANLHGVKLVFNRPGKPVDNASIKSFNRRLRDECLSVNWFRPHYSLSGLTPLEFLRIKKNMPLRMGVLWIQHLINRSGILEVDAECFEVGFAAIDFFVLG